MFHSSAYNASTILFDDHSNAQVSYARKEGTLVQTWKKFHELILRMNEPGEKASRAAKLFCRMYRTTKTF